jgi:hypothetical protein
LAAYTLNDLAWSVGSLALALLVYRRTGSAIGAMAYFLCSQFVPALVAPFAVARIDQRATRIVLPALYATEAVAFLALAWVASNFSLVPILVLTIADGIVALTARPIARAATVAVTAPAGLLREANALTNAAFSICFMGGPALGALVVVGGGTIAALLVNAGLFAASAVVLATSRGLPEAAPEPAPSTGRLRAAFEQARSSRPVRTLLGLQVSAVLIFTIVVPVAVVFAERSLHRGAGGYGVLLSAWGAGAILGSAVYARWRGLRSGVLIALGSASLGVGLAVMAAAPTLAVAIVAAVVGGVGNGVESVAARTALQEQIEQRWMTMIMSFNESLLDAIPGGGILVGGLIAQLAGPRTALAVAAAGALVVAVAAPIILSKAGVAQLAPAAAAGAASQGMSPGQDAKPVPAPAGRR